MLTTRRLDAIRLSARPRGQILVGSLVLTPNYGRLPGVSISFEGVDKIPDEPVIFAMNHTDRFNYWPFQWKLWRTMDRYTATWVKGKYYENRIVGAFMEHTNNIPTVSRGYIIVRDFIATLDRRPTDEEYRLLRRWVDAVAYADDLPDGIESIPSVLRNRRRSIVGRPFEPTAETWAEAVNATFRRMMGRFVELNEEAHALGLDILLFPQGTRSIRLSRGRIGMAQMAQHLGVTIVPVGCNGSDHVYPGSSPFAKSGRIVYRFGDPIAPDSDPSWVPDGPFEPFTAQAETAYRQRFQAMTDVVMERINDLLDPRYRFSESDSGDGVRGSHRFV